MDLALSKWQVDSEQNKATQLPYLVRSAVNLNPGQMAKAAKKVHSSLPGPSGLSALSVKQHGVQQLQHSRWFVVDGCVSTASGGAATVVRA